MKRLLLLISLVWVLSLNVFTQSMEYTTSYNESYRGQCASNQDLEAGLLLYKELNYYRARFGVAPLYIAPQTVNYACRWGAYMLSRYNGIQDRFYEHSKLGPSQYALPTTCGENIHLLYFDHKPTTIEIVHTLMFGRPVTDGENIMGWSQSPSHNENMLDIDYRYMGVSVFVTQKEGYWVVFGVVNLNIVNN